MVKLALTNHARHQKVKTMNTTDYITPTKQSPVFVAECDYFGFIEEGFYKDYCIESNNCSHCGATFELHYTDAIISLHKWIKEHRYVLDEYPKCNFNIYLVDGTMNTKWDQQKETKVYSISAKKAKQLLF